MPTPIKVGYSDPTSPGNWSEMKSVLGKLRVIVNTYWEEIAEVEIPNHNLVRVLGSHTAIADTELILSDTSTGQQFYLDTADEIVATSNSNEDSAGQTGALTIVVQGLTEDVPGTWVRETDTITMTGAPGSGTTTKKFIRFEKAWVDNVGSAGANVGTITFTDQGATGTFMVMLPGAGATKAALASIESGRKILIRDFWATGAGSKNVQVRLYVREYGKSWQVKKEYSLNNNTFGVNILENSIPEKSDIEIRVQALAPGATGAVKAGFLGRTELAGVGI